MEVVSRPSVVALVVAAAVFKVVVIAPTWRLALSRETEPGGRAMTREHKVTKRNESKSRSSMVEMVTDN